MDSTDPMISGASRVLRGRNFDTSSLVIFQGYYLQCVQYIDPIPGIIWYLVVLLSAAVEADYLGPDSDLYNISITIISISILIIFICLLFTIYYRKSRLLKLTQPVFTLCILIGSVSLSINCFFLLGEINNINCTIRPWLFNLSFTLAFSPLLIKSYMVHWLFNLHPMSKNKLIRSSVLCFYTVVFICLDSIIILITTLIFDVGTISITKTELTSSGAYADVTYCSSTRNKIFLYAEISYKGLLIGSACIMSFLIRKIAGTIASSRTLLVIVYNVAFVSGVVLLMIHSFTDVSQIVFCQIIGICICTIITSLVLVAPNIYKLITIGDEAATDDVMGEIFGNCTSSHVSNHASHPNKRSNSILASINVS